MSANLYAMSGSMRTTTPLSVVLPESHGTLPSRSPMTVTSIVSGTRVVRISLNDVQPLGPTTPQRRCSAAMPPETAVGPVIESTRTVNSDEATAVTDVHAVTAAAVTTPANCDSLRGRGGDSGSGCIPTK